MINPDTARIERAKEERRKQLINWDEYDRNYQNNHHNRSRNRGSKNVEFGPDIVFLEAAARGDIDEVKQLLQAGVNPDVTNEDGLTALHQSCIDNNVEMCNLLLENNANVNAKDNELWTPLHAAATCGNKDLCGILIMWGADLLALNVDGNMPYDLCDDEDTLILVETEMAKRNVTQKQIDDIRLLPEQDMLNDLKRRYAAGDDFQALDSQGAAPIHVAAACGYVDAARYLLQNHVDPQQPDQDGWMPIHIAVCWGNLEIVELLVSYGADMEASTKSGQTIDTLCESKEFHERLNEVWDRREELRRAVKQNNAMQNFPRSYGSSRRKNNTSILRTSMRDKRRLTQTAVEREKQLGEQVEAKLVSEAKRTGSSDEIVRPPPTLQGVVNSIAVSASPTNPRQAPTVAIGHGSSPEVNGVALHATRKSSNTIAAPAVPPRHPRDAKSNGAQLVSPQEAPATPSPTSTTSTRDTLSSTETPSESSDSQARYVRPMQRKPNGQMVPVNADAVRLPSSQRPRPTPPTRDNRSRTPRRSEASPANAITGSRWEQRAKSSPSNPILRQGPLPPSGTAKNPTFTNSSSYPSTDTLNSDYDDRRRVFSCCHTM
ncbi:Protein phosphatase 1 regulatory inhibitor subunit 16B [Taenia crassiceps]|uniref:Protein phosphatase 1 regulatory inhibitor subunit 16B n=1 Tax=Taenia crassiceps TaxID=6207 RepID=A0ABR4Q165_9CEST